ncbi:NUDIX domain-containing protein [Flavonifractor sp. An100]|uniref:NUDIX domain-containing protein n=1 Tax=Flavonifractor sp. An100 TaxID=1965538 RepID=UPI000B383489|nr:NUDIX domain-containing protein [Flavonifractor sp. An100]OUQ82266.1 NUDIX hydrolase [Flavonifractor sp. An100]
MRFQFCPHCGSKPVLKEIGDEGLVPWCENCKLPLFPMFATCIIALAVNEDGEVALLRQGYLSQQYHVLVSGYMKPGESAETCAAREIREELGLEVSRLVLTGTYWLEKKDMLMIGFLARVHKQDFHLSGEVDQAVWVTSQKALTLLHPYPAISYLVADYFVQHPHALDLPNQPAEPCGVN